MIPTSEFKPEAEEAIMKGVWGSLISVLVIMLGFTPARAGFFETKGYDPLPVAEGEYTPPSIFNNCAVAVAGGNVVTVASCLPRPNTSDNKEDRFVFDETRRNELVQVNAEFNALLSTTISLEEATQVAVGKMTRLVELGWPETILSYAIAETESDDELYHAVMLVVFNTRAFVLDSMSDEIFSWQLSPYRLVGMESGGRWHPVLDDRHEPSSYYYDESFCAEHHCPMVAED